MVEMFTGGHKVIWIGFQTQLAVLVAIATRKRKMQKIRKIKLDNQGMVEYTSPNCHDETQTCFRRPLICETTRTFYLR